MDYLTALAATTIASGITRSKADYKRETLCLEQLVVKNLFTE